MLVNQKFRGFSGDGSPLEWRVTAEGRNGAAARIDGAGHRWLVPSMARGARVTPGGLVSHVLNRSVADLALFREAADYEAFERIRT